MYLHVFFISFVCQHILVAKQRSLKWSRKMKNWPNIFICCFGFTLMTSKMWANLLNLDSTHQLICQHLLFIVNLSWKYVDEYFVVFLSIKSDSIIYPHFITIFNFRKVKFATIHFTVHWSVCVHRFILENGCFELCSYRNLDDVYA